MYVSSSLAWLLCVATAIGPGEAIVGGIRSAVPPLDDPVVFVRVGGRAARVEGTRNRATGLYSFRGIYYADPPTGEYRFTRSRFRHLSGDVNATRNGPPCPQPDPTNPYRVVGNEDCLLLNIFTPQMPDETTGLPVVVWIHGGGYRYGSASQYGAEPLTSNGVIFVPIQYRLGSFGMIGDGSRDFSGNLALLDMATAVRWVKDYIGWFGGDPAQIKLVGHGSGATAAMVLASSTMARSSVTGVVAMSGSSLQPNAYEVEPVMAYKEATGKHRCMAGNETEVVKCLRMHTTNEIVLMDNELQTDRFHGEKLINGMTPNAGVNPIVEEKDDGRGLPGLLTDKPETILSEGDIPKIPLLIGVAKDETANAIDVKEVQSVFKGATNFLRKTSSLVGLDAFLNVEKQLSGLDTVGGVLKLDKYLEVPNGLDPTVVLGKLIEATTDAIFNLPAVVSAQAWSKASQAFMYSFDYRSESTRGKDFLAGLPIVNKSGTNGAPPEAVAHGDELGLLFDTQDLFGNPVPTAKITSPKDQNARKSFASFIAKFAYLNTSSMHQDNVFKTFSSKGTPFVKIGEKITVDNDFRFCQLSLWGAQLESLKSISCSFLGQGLGSVSKVVGNVLPPNPVSGFLFGG
ncbi:carboxylesterase 3 [Anopheles darlingi]|uniref:Carboxylesterase 3 n=1 Tax=Anopheles darlingi TaxID=43151 RepID=W5J0R3_ANODA|nr:carboxylesterase 5A [Anopheles darlingi]ETN57722.1 carboxylesterase 3 [Anopheles darlingi]